MEEVGEITGRLSLLSYNKAVTEEEIQNIRKTPPPPDKFFIVHLLFLILGLVSLLPVTFFITANDYWMYKFRDPSSNSTDANNRTTLQKNFAPAQLVGQAVPSLISTILSARYAYKLRLRSRIIGCLGLLIMNFAVFTIFIKLDTDNWQVLFFCITILTLSVINVTHALLQFSFLVQISKFPQKFMRLYMYGQGGSGLFGSSLQVISIAAGNGNSETTALIYFISGCLVLSLCLILYYVSKKCALFNYYDDIKEENTNRAPRTWKEIKNVLQKIWPVLVVIVTVLLSLFAGHPTLTSLVVSENHDSGGAWNTKYFVPVITFLFGDILSLIGRFFAKPFITKKTRMYWVVGSILRVAIFVPLFMFCNAYPRSYLPVAFKHDWEYILILGIFAFSLGLLFTSVYLSVPGLLDGKDLDLGFEMLQLIGGVSASLLSPLGLVVVNIL